jgi:hypothetical protein
LIRSLRVGLASEGLLRPAKLPPMLTTNRPPGRRICFIAAKAAGMLVFQIAEFHTTASTGASMCSAAASALAVTHVILGSG